MKIFRATVQLCFTPQKTVVILYSLIIFWGRNLPSLFPETSCRPQRCLTKILSCARSQNWSKNSTSPMIVALHDYFINLPQVRYKWKICLICLRNIPWCFEMAAIWPLREGGWSICVIAHRTLRAFVSVGQVHTAVWLVPCADYAARWTSETILQAVTLINKCTPITYKLKLELLTFLIIY